MTGTLLDNVKKALNITGDYQNATLEVYIEEVQDFILGAGVPADKITAGLVARGVSDLWNYGAGEGKLSDYFKLSVTQKALNSKG
jgi:hypothetical protein